MKSRIILLFAALSMLAFVSCEKDEAAPAACSDPVSFNAHIDAVNDEFFVACLDIGHGEMRTLGTSSVEMIHTLGDSLAALHIHDNN